MVFIKSYVYSLVDNTVAPRLSRRFPGAIQRSADPPLLVSNTWTAAMMRLAPEASDVAWDRMAVSDVPMATEAPSWKLPVVPWSARTIASPAIPDVPARTVSAYAGLGGAATS